MFYFKSLSTLLPNIYLQTSRSLVSCCRLQGSKPLLAREVKQENGLSASAKPSNAWSLDLIRTNVRNNFPYPKEAKRIKAHGYKKRMSTPGGRAILMRRILKGRHVLSH